MTDFPQIHLMNLERSTDRLQLFKERNPHITDFVRISAVDGSMVDREALIQSGTIREDLTYGHGALGCALSHVGAWEMAVSQQQPITIFEDAIAVANHFYKSAKNILSQLPHDWDFILWGYSLNPLFVWVDLGISKVRLSGYGANRYQNDEGISQFQAEITSPTAVRLMHCFGTLAYSISPKGAHAALNYYLPLHRRSIQFPEAGVTTVDEGVDCALCGLYPLLKSYICIPQLAIRCTNIESVRMAIDSADSLQI